MSKTSGVQDDGLGQPHSAEIRRYSNRLWDNDRWQAFVHRPGDIVISTAYKSGTSWMQRICSLLVFGTSELEASLDEISPWLDATSQPQQTIFEAFERQTHRRFIKTHCPLDGMRLRDDVDYICVARDPRDVCISMWHQIPNSRRLSQDAVVSSADFPTFLRAWLTRPGIDGEADGWPYWSYFNHAHSCWRERERANVHLIHFQDLLDDLSGVMRRLAERLGLQPPADAWPSLVAAARFDAMKSAHTLTTPGVAWNAWKDNRAFFRRGTSGEWRERFTSDDLKVYDRAVADKIPEDLNQWLHRDVNHAAGPSE